MISRVYFEDFLSFEEVDLEFEKGLIVFTGPSGAGKSILMEAFLSLFAYKDARAKLSEVSIENCKIEDENFMIEKDDEIIIKALKKEKVRYFINNQTINKKSLQEFSKTIVKFLHLKDTSDFEESNLVSFLDKLSLKNDSNFTSLQNSFKKSFEEFKAIQKKLEKIENDEKQIEELKEFTKYEIDKISLIDPKTGEYEELNLVKKHLSKKEKIENAIKNASEIFNYTRSVSTALELLEVDSSFFDDAINELNNQFEKINDSLEELNEIDIEQTLDRIEKLSNLHKKFGSIELALEYKEKKQQELISYENITFEKLELQKRAKELDNEIKIYCTKLTKYRENSAKELEDSINTYLKELYLNNVKIDITQKELDSTGTNGISFELNGVDLQTISSGEFNRLRLALLTAQSEIDIAENGILFLDEIDANLSGKESSAIAKVLTTLSKNYQIFAISHQPQLTANAKGHYLVEKIDGKSRVKRLVKSQRVNEIARMISGENITQEAITFAQKLLNNDKSN